MFSHSVKLLLAFHFALMLLSFHLTDVQALGIPDVVASLMNKRSRDSVTGGADEEARLKIVSELLDRARDKKSVTLQDEDFGAGDEEQRRDANDLKRFLETKLAPSLDKLKRTIFLKHSSSSGVDRDAKQQRRDDVQLKDRDYFQAIGIAPQGGYDYKPSYSWSHWGSSDDY